MKKILSILLVLLMLCSVALTACDTGSSDTSAASSSSSSNGDSNNGGGGNGGGGGGGNKPDTPTAGYSFKTIDNRLRIEYPSTWEDQTEDEAFCCMETASFSILSVYADDDPYWYDFEFNENFDESDLLESFQQYDSMEFKKLERLNNANGVTVNTISFSYQMNQTMIMYLFEVKIDEIYYEIQLMMPEGNDIIAQTVFDSITDVSTAPGSGNGGDPELIVPTGYKTFTNYNLRFAYPDAWTTDSSANSRDVVINGGSNFRLYLHSSPKTTMFDGLTDDIFRDTYVENLETQYGGTIDSATVEYRENDNGLLVASIMFSITTENAIEGEIWYCVTIDETTHCLILRTAVEDETLFVTIFNSLTATDGPNVSNGSESDPGASTKPEGTDPGTSTKPEGTDPGTSTTPSNPSNNEREIYEEAKNFYKEGAYDKAYALFSQIPDYPGVDKYLDELEELLNSNDSSSKNEK